MSDVPHEPEQQHRSPGGKRGGIWWLLVLAVVLLLCGCGSLLPNASGQEAPADEDPVTMMTELIIQIGFIIGGLVCIGVAVYRLAATTDHPDESGAPRPHQPAGQGSGWALLIVGCFLLVGSCFLGTGVGVIGGILATDTPDVAGPFLIFGVLVLIVVAGLALGFLAVRHGYLRLKRGAVRE